MLCKENKRVGNVNSWAPFDNLPETDILNLDTKAMFEALTNDDMWRKFSLPLTPPSSPPRTYGESSDDEEISNICEIAERLHDVCERLDSAFDVLDTASRLPDVLHSKLISDCMWSGNQQTTHCYTSESLKLNTEPEIEIFPTPCPSPLPVVTEYPSTDECVDPTTVFPACSLTGDIQNSSTSESEDEIDVVNIEVKPRKRKRPVSKVVITGKFSTKRSKHSSGKFRSRYTPEHWSFRKALSADDSDPEVRRATHNVLERQRRIDLRQSFERLRDCVPNGDKEKAAPKVVVLKKAADLIRQLTQEEIELTDTKRILQNEKQNLLIRLQQLQNDLTQI